MRHAATTPRFQRALHARHEHAWRVPTDCRAQHAALVQSRIRALAPVLAAATLLWIPVDSAWLGVPVLLHSVPLRVGIAAALLLAAHVAPRVRAPVAVHAFLWPQALGFGLLQWLVDPARNSALEIGYGLFPFVLAAQLAVLPLPWGRALIASIAPTLQLGATLLIGEERGAALWNAAWLFVLLVIVAAWTSHAQLRLLVDLLGARRDAAHDPLTALANRRTAIRRLEAERQRALRIGEPLSVLMLDLDHFKQVNDRWGHAAGDRVLAAVAQVLREELRGMDLPSRHGGEEFLAILPGAGPAQALEAAGRIRERIARERIDLGAGTVALTVSIGVATLTPGATVDELVTRADAALYAAKDRGRNCCVQAGDAVLVLAGEADEAEA